MSDQEYKRQLGEVLGRRDASALRGFLEASAARYGDQGQVEAIRQKSEEELVELMHRMILARPDLAHLHTESQRRLQTRQTQPAPRAPGPRRGNGRRG